MRSWLRGTGVGAAFLLLLLQTGCAGMTQVEPFAEAPQRARLDGEDARFWDRGDEFDRVLSRSNRLHGDAELDGYLQGVLDRLYPEFRGALRVRVVGSPIPNAFALPNGSLYVHIGLLALLDNEAQIASVLAHEGAHFIEKHALRQSRTVKSGAAFAQVVNLAGVPLLGELIAVSSMYGYSRDLEREADTSGFTRLRRAGYATAEGVAAFRHLSEQAQAEGDKESFFFSSHPKMAERIASFEELGRGERTGGRIGAADYLARTAAARLLSLEEDLAQGRYKSVIFLLEKEGRKGRYPAYRDYFLGEAYRQRGENGDLERAAQAHAAAIVAAPDFAPAYRALGVLELKAGRNESAARHLEGYLRLAPGASDRAYVEQYLKELGRR